MGTEGSCCSQRTSLKDANRFEARLVQTIIKEVKKMLPIRKFALPPNIIGFDQLFGTFLPGYKMDLKMWESG
ncbi:unnamed protein product [Rhodiola kirilowii]